MRREAILLVAFGMLLATSVAYGVPNLTVEWQKEYRDPYELHQTCTSALQAFDVDGDGDIEIILPFRKDSDRIVCVSGSDGSVEWIYPPMEQEPTSGDPMGAPAIGDMDGDGKYEVVFLGRSNNIYCIDGTTGAGKWIYECEGADDAVMLYDIDGDGYKEAIAQGGDNIVVVDHQGNEKWKFQLTSKIDLCPNAFDIDKDGQVEVIGADSSYVYCLSPTGVEKWRFAIGGELNHETPIIADFNNDGEYEIVFHAQDRYTYMLTFYGSEIWRFPVGQKYWEIDDRAGLHEGGLAAADLDGDGFLEIVDTDRMGNVYALNHDGSVLWYYKLPEEVWSGVLIGDFTGDGQLDVIVEGEGNETHPIYPAGVLMVLNGATGEEEICYPQALTASTPSAADMDGDGLVEIVAQAWSGPITVLTTNAPYIPATWMWRYKYKTPENHAVYELGEPIGPTPWLKVEWQREYSDEYSLHQTCDAGLQAYDVDKDGLMDIVIPFRKDSDRIMCVSAQNGDVKWVYPPMDQDGIAGDPMGVPAIGDMDGDGKDEILFTGRSNNLYCIDAATGQEKWIHESAGKDESVCLYDINGDGKLEAIYQAGDTVTVVDWQGKLVWEYQMTKGASTAPNAFDIDRDGQVEVVIGDGNGNLFCLSSTGTEKWRFQAGDRFRHQQAIIADFNNDGEYEIAAHSDDGYLYLLTFFGTELWRFPVGQKYWEVNDNAGNHEGGMAAADIDGDGSLEIVTTDMMGNVYAVNDDGSQLWYYKLPEEVWSGTLICDFTGDGKLDVIVEGEENQTNPYPFGMVAVLAGDTGELQLVYPQGLTASTPSVGDFDSDGKVEMVAQAWSAPIMVLTADGTYDPNLMPWPYNYKTPGNNGVIPVPEAAVAAALISSLVLAGIRVRRQ